MHIPLWTPSPERVAGCAMTQFRARAAALAGRDLPDQAALYAWSLAEPGAFWRLLWDEAGVIGEPGDVALAPGATMREARWFPEGRLYVA